MDVAEAGRGLRGRDADGGDVAGVGGDGVGWWVLVFAGLRAVVGVVAIVWIAPRMIARLSPGAEPTAPDAGDDRR
ncbi:hypothetical protein DZF97_04480 [Clavibacter nebraskensis]|uniref:Uncharacterized protein n=1 Tax=Clavibacter nebraskensis TaxID=31963 RepID=A0A399QAY1_9MICO|nr:hypothetical protein DZF97_04480 [Clavibacter nebraskensis]